MRKIICFFVIICNICCITLAENVIPNNALNYESTGFASYLYDYYKINGRNETREFVKKYLIQNISCTGLTNVKEIWKIYGL